MFWTFEAVFKLRNLRKLYILRLRARSVICIKHRQNSQEGGTTFARHVQILPRHRLTNQKRFLCFNQQQITKELGPGFPRALLAVCHAQKRRALGSRINLVPRADVPFGQHQDTELWNNQFPETKILGLPASQRMRGLV